MVGPPGPRPISPGRHLPLAAVALVETEDVLHPRVGWHIQVEVAPAPAASPVPWRSRVAPRRHGGIGEQPRPHAAAQPVRHRSRGHMAHSAVTVHGGGSTSTPASAEPSVSPPTARRSGVLPAGQTVQPRPDRPPPRRSPSSPGCSGTIWSRPVLHRLPSAISVLAYYRICPVAIPGNPLKATSSRWVPRLVGAIAPRARKRHPTGIGDGWRPSTR